MTEEELEIEQELDGQFPRIMVANHTSEMDVLPIRAKGHLRIMGYDFYKRMVRNFSLFCPILFILLKFNTDFYF